MSIVTTEILGTDSISASRIVINDNFSILRDEINAIEVYLDPNAGTLDGLNSIESLNLNIGQPGNYILEVTPTAFEINNNTDFNGNVNINGIISNNSFSLIDESAFTGVANINPLTGFSNYIIVHASTSSFDIILEQGNPGQIITFAVEQKGGGSVILSSGTSTVFVLDATNNNISLDDVGSTVTLKYMLDSSNNGAWFIVSSHNITLV
jgi:hypothetical protein